MALHLALKCLDSGRALAISGDLFDHVADCFVHIGGCRFSRCIGEASAGWLRRSSGQGSSSASCAIIAPAAAMPAAAAAAAGQPSHVLKSNADAIQRYRSTPSQPLKAAARPARAELHRQGYSAAAVRLRLWTGARPWVPGRYGRFARSRLCGAPMARRCPRLTSEAAPSRRPAAAECRQTRFYCSGLLIAIGLR